MPLVVGNKRSIVQKYTLEVVAQVIFVTFCAIVQLQASKKLDKPFIDEIFHLRQCQKYCDGKFLDWDPKITTPPGLYIVGYLYTKALQLVTKENICSSYAILRSVNLIGGLLALPFAARAFKRIDSNQFWSVNIVSQSLLFPYYFLFYTDIWSTIFIVLSLSYAVSKPAKVYPSALFGLISLTFRQTNVVWLAFVVSVFIDRKLDTRENIGIGFVSRVSKFIVQIFKEWKSLVPYVISLGLFGVFIVVNGGITLGDKENHQIKAHVVQVFYCLTFLTFFTWPVWLRKSTVLNYVKYLTKYYGANILVNAAYSYGIKLIIEKFTVVHPFLLADNRHYTFYIFKRLISHPHSQWLSIPIYHFSTWNVISSLNNNNRISLSPITIITFVAAICLTIIPSPLFEPRYYIVPLIVYRLYIKPTGTYRHLLEFAWLNSINLVLIIIFFKIEFTWISEPGSIQRIIW